MNDASSKLAAFIAELRQRRVFRVAVVYAGVAFIVFQVADFAFPALHVPDWFSSAVVVLLLLGFFIAVGMAWAFDLTAEGLVRAKVKREPTAAKAPHHPLVGNKTLAVIAAVAVAVAVWSWWGRPPQADPIRRIAVLPLYNIGGDPEEEYFVEGMHEAITSNLSRISALTVISRTSTMRYKDTDKLMPEIARELNADALVEGSAQRVGDQVLITAQLIDGRTDEHLWANDYEGDLTDILSLQKRVARAIAKEIGLALKPEEEAYLASAPQVNPEAYKLYLKGWHFRTLESRESMPRAVEYLEQAVALDSTFAKAWAVLSWTRDLAKLNGQYGGNLDSILRLGDEALDKALELDPNLPEAYVYLGLDQYIGFGKMLDIDAAEASFRHALDLDPSNVNARYEYGMFLMSSGRPSEALAEHRQAHELDPLNPLPLNSIGWVYSNLRQYDKALEYRQAVWDLSPDLTTGPLVRVEYEILMQQGRYAEVAEQRGVNTLLGMRARMAMGNEEEVYTYRDSLLSTGELQQLEQSNNPTPAILIYGIMGERDKALSLLERASEDSSIGFLGLIRQSVYSPTLDFLRGEPRFKALMQKMGLTEVFDQYGERIR